MTRLHVDRRQVVLGMSSALAMPSGVSASIQPRARTIRFIVVGDWGRNGAHYQKEVACWMHCQACLGCDFIVSTGDNFYNFGVASVDDSKWRTSYEGIYSAELRRLPWFPVAGNHDWGGNIWAQLDRSGKGTWTMPWLFYDVPGRAFGRPDVHLFFIDTVVWRAEETALYRYCGQSLRGKDIRDQALWLSSALSESKATTKLVFGHHPIFSVGKHGGAYEMPELDRLLIDHGVSAYICGHDHCLYHIRKDSMDYICSGGGSEELTTYGGGPAEYPGCVIATRCEDATLPKWHQFIPKAGFAVFELDERGIKFQFVDRSGAILPQPGIPIRGHAPVEWRDPRPIDKEVLKERTQARGRTNIACARIPQRLIDIFD